MIMRRGFAGLLLTSLVVAAISGCGQTTSYRYKMTIEVETPEGVRTGSAVRQVQYFEPGNYPSIGESRPQWGVKGQAIAVDLPGGKVLFALLTSGDGDFDYAGRDIDHMFRELGRKQIQLWPNPPKTTAPRINDPLPMLVTFENITDPTTVERVDPNDLATIYGSSYRLKMITVQVSNEPVTMGIEKQFPWWAKFHDKQLDGHRYSDSTEFANTLNRMSFSRGLNNE